MKRFESHLRTMESNMDIRYDYGKYRDKILKMNFVLVLIVFLIEVGISIMLYTQNAINETMGEYLVRYLIIPTVFNFSLVGIQYYVTKRGAQSERIQNYFSVMVLTVLCCVVSFTHYVFACTLLVYCVPIFTSVLFGDKKIMRTVAAVSIIGVLLTGAERFYYTLYRADSRLLPEISIAIASVFLSCYVGQIIMGLIEEQNMSLVASMREAQDAKEEADQANRAKGQFLARMSHEIRTPINAVLGLDTMILRQSKEENIRSYARDIQSAGKSLLSVVNDILDFSKVESGKMELVCEDYEFASLIHDVVNMIQPKAIEKNLQLHIDVDRHMPCRFYGDDIRIKQVLVNLLSNAVKYTQEGRVTLYVRANVEDDRAKLYFSVKDTGIGIKHEDISKLNEAFVRIEETRNRNIEGTGLGINIVSALLQLMGSKLEAHSEYGEGSNFHFDLWQKITDEREIGDINAQIQEAVDEEEYKVEFKIPDCRMLLVDDNSINRKVFCNLLRDMECQIDEADSGEKCLSLVEHQKYDLIFMDHMMPIMDGIETFQKMKDMGDYINAQTPVIILTANAINGAREEYLSEGFSEYLSKPIDPDVLERMIGRMIPEDRKYKEN